MDKNDLYTPYLNTPCLQLCGNCVLYKVCSIKETIIKKGEQTMDYEKEYKSAIERAKGIMRGECGITFVYSPTLFDYLFPELKSDDERIRKVIYGLICIQPQSFFDSGFSKNEMLAWLEKQSKENMIEALRLEYEKGKADGLQEQRKEWTAEDLLNRNEIADILQEYNRDDLIDWLEKQGEKTSAIRWYDVSLIPQEMEELLVEWDSEDATWHEIAFYHADTKTFWSGTKQVENVTRWCYIIDLLEKQGEQKVPVNDFKAKISRRKQAN